MFLKHSLYYCEKKTIEFFFCIFILMAKALFYFLSVAFPFDFMFLDLFFFL